MTAIRFQILFLIPAMIGMLACPLPAQDDVAEVTGKSTSAAKSLTKSAGKSRGDLAEIAAEAGLNRLDEPKPAPLTSFSQSLGQLEGAQLAPLLESLRAAEATTGDTARRTALVAAFSRQKALELALKDSAGEFSPGEAQLRLVREIAALLGRQTNNIRQISELAASATLPGELNGSALRRHAVAGVEQAALEQEISLMARISGQRPSDWPEEIPTAAAVRDGIRSSELLPSLRDATGATRSGPLAAAAAQQKIAGEKLSELLDTALDAAPPNLIAADSKKLLREITAEERELRQATADAATDNPTLAERQNRLEERTEILQRLIKRLNPEAAQAVGQAGEKMRQGAGLLAGEGSGGGAIPAETEAIGLLGKAAGMLASGNGAGGGDGDGEFLEEPGGTEVDPDDNEQMDDNSPDSIPPSALAVGELVKKEREAFSISKEEGTLPEYVPLIEQYLRSLTEPPVSP